FRRLPLPGLFSAFSWRSAGLRLAARVPRQGLHRRAWPDFLEPFYHHDVTRIQAFVDQSPSVDFGPECHGDRVDHPVAYHHEGIHTIMRALNRLHEDKQGYLVSALLHTNTHIHA